MKITLEQIKELREKTGAGIMECRRALEEANGEIKKAEKILLERGIEKAEKKEGRATSQGLVDAYVHGGGKIGVLVEVSCETDFVARTDDFKKLTHELCLQIASMEPKTVEVLLAQPYIRDASMTVLDLVKSTIGKLGENIVVKRFTRMTLGE